MCYFGLLEPLVQTQVLPYLREIRQTGISVSLLTFESDFRKKWTRDRILAEQAALKENGIEWHALPYHKTPPVISTFYDLLRGLLFTIRLARKEKIDIFHSRGHIPAPIAAIAKRICGGKMIFDIRGLMPEEYTDAGLWRESGYTYRIVKRVEKWLMKRADGFVVLTEKGRDLLFPESRMTGRDKEGRPVEVIPCCIDPARFDLSNEIDDNVSIPGINNRGPVFVYVGSFGGWYLRDETVDFFVQMQRKEPNSFMLVLTQRDVDGVRQAFLDSGVSESDFAVECVPPKAVPVYLRKADIALSFIKACYSKQASSPTKIAEYLASGLPVVSGAGIGDLDTMIEKENVGVVVRGFTKEVYAETFNKINAIMEDKEASDRCKIVADNYFDLQKVGGPAYRRLYKKLLDNE